MADSFSLGDVVQLKSGGPTMTVNSIDDNEVECVWFVKDQQQYGSFPAVVLRKYTPPSFGGSTVIRG
jgi:uncharacterized protein YodC (DUF2158 family)